MLARRATIPAGHTTVAAVLAALLLGFAVGAGAAAPAPTATPTATLSVVAREFLFEPKQLLAKAGEVTFTVKNAGVIEHDVVIEDARRKIVARADVFAAGKTVQVKTRLAAGSYTVFCSVPGHREAGMLATLTARP